MTGPLTAGDPLAPSGRKGRGTPEEPAGRPARKAPARRKGPGILLRTMRGLFGAMLAVLLLVGIAGAGAAWMAYQHYSADLPDVDGLRSYQPPVMSRVYTGDSRLLAELAAERRIFVPIGAIPDIV